VAAGLGRLFGGHNFKPIQLPIGLKLLNFHHCVEAA
jgi:hypothetical protein